MDNQEFNNSEAQANTPNTQTNSDSFQKQVPVDTTSANNANQPPKHESSFKYDLATHYVGFNKFFSIFYLVFSILGLVGIIVVATMSAALVGSASSLFSGSSFLDYGLTSLAFGGSIIASIFSIISTIIQIFIYVKIYKTRNNYNSLFWVVLILVWNIVFNGILRFGIGNLLFIVFWALAFFSKYFAAQIYANRTAWQQYKNMEEDLGNSYHKVINYFKK